MPELPSETAMMYYTLPNDKSSNINQLAQAL
ncbi:hypothetical protein N779_09800 [Vibrio coralliilyticus OCN008]|nr:hypothetical protein N779_09800 [Vibrio coralliilyticus OCN008]